MPRKHLSCKEARTGIVHHEAIARFGRRQQPLLAQEVRRLADGADDVIRLLRAVACIVGHQVDLSGQLIKDKIPCNTPVCRISRQIEQMDPKESSVQVISPDNI